MCVPVCTLHSCLLFRALFVFFSQKRKPASFQYEEGETCCGSRCQCAPALVFKAQERFHHSDLRACAKARRRATLPIRLQVDLVLARRLPRNAARFPSTLGSSQQIREEASGVCLQPRCLGLLFSFFFSVSVPGRISKRHVWYANGWSE